MTSLNSTPSVVVSVAAMFVREVYMYCSREIIVFGLPDADRQRYIDKFKSLGIGKCAYEIPRTEWADDSVAAQMASTACY